MDLLVILKDMSGSTFIYAAIAGIVPSLIWIFFWLREDAEHPEPRTMLIYAFMGGVAAVLGAIFVERYISQVVVELYAKYSLWAAAEEILKFVAVALIALHGRYFDEPIDAMIYCIMGALGFAAVENALFALDPLTTGSILDSIATVNMRFIGATLVHTVSSALVGFSIGIAFYRGYATRIIASLIGLSLAIALHAGFNLSIINSTAAQMMTAFAWIWASVVILIVLFEEIKAVRPRLKY